MRKLRNAPGDKELPQTDPAGADPLPATIAEQIASDAKAQRAAAGGWKDVNTLLEIYQQPDDAGVFAVMSETRKLHERGVA
jgi:hypothetical protein